MPHNLIMAELAKTYRGMPADEKKLYKAQEKADKERFDLENAGHQRYLRRCLQVGSHHDVASPYTSYSELTEYWLHFPCLHTGQQHAGRCDLTSPTGPQHPRAPPPLDPGTLVPSPCSVVPRCGDCTPQREKRGRSDCGGSRATTLGTARALLSRHPSMLILRRAPCASGSLICKPLATPARQSGPWSGGSCRSCTEPMLQPSLLPAGRAGRTSWRICCCGM